MTVVFWSTPEPMWLYLTPHHDGFLCNAIWGLKSQAQSTELSCLALHVLCHLWIPWIFSQYSVWYLVSLTHLWNLAQSDELWSSFVCKNSRCSFYIQIDLPWPITNSPAYCKLFQNSLIWIFYNLFTSFCLCPNFFEMCCNQAKVVNLLNTFTSVSENFGNIFFLLLNLNTRHERGHRRHDTREDIGDMTRERT